MADLRGLRPPFVADNTDQAAEAEESESKADFKQLTHDAQIMGKWLVSLLTPVDLELKGYVALTDIQRLNALATDAEKYYLLTLQKRSRLKRIADSELSEQAATAKARATAALKSADTLRAVQQHGAGPGSGPQQAAFGNKQPLHALKYAAEQQIEAEWRQVESVGKILRDLPSFQDTREAKYKTLRTCREADKKYSVFVEELARYVSSELAL